VRSSTRILLSVNAAQHTHADPPCLPLISRVGWSFPNIPLKFYRTLVNSIIIQKSPEPSSATGPGTLHADFSSSACRTYNAMSQSYSLSYSASELESAEPVPEPYRISHTTYLYYVKVD